MAGAVWWDWSLGVVLYGERVLGGGKNLEGREVSKCDTIRGIEDMHKTNGV